MVAVRFLPVFIILVIGFCGVFTFGEEIPIEPPPVPEIVNEQLPIPEYDTY